jgi:hypothetical protein
MLPCHPQREREIFKRGNAPAGAEKEFAHSEARLWPMSRSFGMLMRVREGTRAPFVVHGHGWRHWEEFLIRTPPFWRDVGKVAMTIRNGQNLSEIKAFYEDIQT